MNKTEFERRLKMGEDLFATTPEDVSVEGLFNSRLQSCAWGSSNAGDSMVTREWLILDGEEENVVVTDRFILKQTGEHKGKPDSWGVRLFKKFVRQCGVDVPTSKAEAEEACAIIHEMAPCYQIQVKVNNGFTNVYTNKRIEGGAYEPAEVPVEEEATESATQESTQSTTPAGVVVGQRVSFVDGESGETVEGTVAEVAMETADIETAKEILEVKLANLTVLTDDSADDTAEPEPDAEVGDEEALDEFAQSHEIDVYTDDTRESVIAKIQSKSYRRDTLTADEVALLESVNVRIVEPEKPKAAAKKKKAKKKAKASTKKKKRRA